MFRHYRDDLNTIVIVVVVLGGCISIVNTVDVRLKDGQAENQGRVEVRRNANETWGKVCDYNFGEEEASVVCRQLNYKYSRRDENVYIPEYPDYRLENFKCNGNESKFDECIEREWKTGTGICNVRSNAYASVCCSNSPTFGEMHEGMFVSHCADSWVDAEEICEGKEATLATSGEYKNILGSVHKLKENENNENKGYWTRSFFTPWIWSNGCYQFNEETFVFQEFNLENNTAQACLQMCSIASEPSAFLLSGQSCRCMPTESLKSNISEVFPGWCNKKCLGDSSYFCGSGVSGSGTYWSLYTKASEDIFYRISDPQTYQYKQCAILETSTKLSSENCYKRVGYICGQILQENNTLPKLMFFQNSRFYEVIMLEARAKCTSDDSTMRLIGEKVLDPDVIFSQPFDNLWVDISRILADVYTIYWEPKNRGETSLWRNLEPGWCMATRQRDIYLSDEITACQTKFRYICSINMKKDQTSSSNGSSSQNANDTGSQTTVIIAVVCGVLIGITIVVLALLYRRYKNKRQSDQKERESQDVHVPQNEYTASIRINKASEHIYAEIKTSSENIYHEADALLEDPGANESSNTNKASGDINEQDKEPVNMKRSYSSPKDLTTLTEGSENQDFKDPNYIYPYDKVQRSEINKDSSGVEDQKAHEMGKNEITNQHNKNTVV
ncbi:uncharacterized protein LOC123561407 isoform X2 [Mercenaria mercenaria]|uniref:uncharacterized protein LOC123561407 isoform X2 n=1 Tax=Mercenaria mercenaria TaxID=6596 RepID=UPI00234F4092|nr:uncharacterized protein LOC123561407 isoform X2 [Mercenaria mercenaria]